MKKTLFLSAILGAALCSNAFAETVTISGTQNNLNLNDAAYAGKDLILNLTGGYFYGNGVNSVFSQNIQVGDGSETQGGIIGNNGWGNLVTFSGTITGNGEIKKTGNGTNLKHAFTGDVTGYTGNITLGASANFYLCFGAVNDGTAATSQNSTATAGVSGTGDITFTSDKNDLVYKYAASAGTVYITNAIKKDGGTAKVQLLGGGSYSFEKDVTIDTLTLGDNSVILLADSSKQSSLGSIQGTGTLKYTGSTQWAFGRNNMAATVTLEGVMAEDGVTSNVKYNAAYGANAGIIKNVNIEDLDAGAGNGSITLDGAYGSVKLGGVQRNITLTGEGLHLTAAGSPQTGKNSYTFNVLAGDGKFVKAFEADQNITIVDATAWTGTYSNTADNSTVIFSGNTNASMEGGTVQLGGTAYAGDHISNAVVTVTSAEAVSISNKLTNVTLNATGKDVTLSGEVNGGTLTGVTMGNQTIKGNVILDAVTLTNQLSLDNGASLTLQNGVTDNGSSTFAFIVGGTGKTGTLTFAAGSYDLTNHGTGIAVYTGSTMTVQSGAAVDVTSVYFASTLANNGDVTVNNGGTLNLTGGTSNIGVLTANGAVTVAGNLSTNAQLAVGGTYTQTENTATVKTYLDLADNATVTLGDGSMEVQGTAGAQGIWFHSGSHIDLTGTVR